MNSWSVTNFFPKRLAGSSMKRYLDNHLDLGKNYLRCPPSANEKLLEGLESIQSRKGAGRIRGSGAFNDLARAEMSRERFHLASCPERKVNG